MTTGLDVFDKTVQETNLWLKGVMTRLQSGDRHLAYRALRAVLHALRDRVGTEQAVHFGAQLPMLLRGLFYEGWRLGGSATKERHAGEFFVHLGREFAASDVDGEHAARAVFAVISEMVDRGETDKLVQHLPKELRALFPPRHR